MVGVKKGLPRMWDEINAIEGGRESVTYLEEGLGVGAGAPASSEGRFD